MSRFCFCLLVSYVLVVISGNADNMQCKQSYWTITKCHDALRLIFEYLLRNYDQLDFDSIIGVRIAEGQLSLLLSHINSSVVPDSLRHDIKELVDLTKKLGDVSLPMVAASDPAYFSQLGVVLKDDFWTQYYPVRRINDSLVYPTTKTLNDFNETSSDRCLSQFTGGRELNGHPCNVSDSCWDMMTRPYADLYILTHQILFLLIGESMKCQKVIDEKIDKFCRLYNRCHTLTELQDVFCANVFYEMKELEKLGFPLNSPDLFLEQAAVCGILGYAEVCRLPWLKLMLSWQLPSGCYARTGRSFKSHLSRQKRYDIRLRDGCSTHKTSVATAALGVCLRYYVQNPTLKICLH